MNTVKHNYPYDEYLQLNIFKITSLPIIKLSKLERGNNNYSNNNNNNNNNNNIGNSKNNNIGNDSHDNQNNQAVMTSYKYMYSKLLYRLEADTQWI